MKYIIDEEELKEMLYASDYSSKDVEEIIADKKPVEMIASGEVCEAVNQSYLFVQTDKDKTNMYVIPKKINKKYTGKSIKIYIEE